MLLERRNENVSGTSCKLLDKDVTTYQEQPARYLKKSFQRIRNVSQVIYLYKEDVPTYQDIWQVT